MLKTRGQRKSRSFFPAVGFVLFHDNHKYSVSQLKKRKEMGRKAKWFVAIKHALTPECNKKSLKSPKSKQKTNYDKSKQSNSVEVTETPGFDAPLSLPPPPVEEIKVIRKEDEQNRHAYSVALASAVAAEAAAVAAQAAAEVVRLTATATSRVQVRSKEEIAAIRIQTAFRGYLARRALRGLKGLVRLKTLVDGAAVRRQTINALHVLQTMSRVQSQIRSRRARMTEENLALQRQLQLNHERELEKLKIGEEWDDSLQSKEQIEARLLYKHEAAIRRERALAYAFSHQWKSSSRAVAPMFTDLNNPQWGWSWLERWMAARPWESRNIGGNDRVSMKNANHNFAHTTKTNRENNTPTVQGSRPSSRQSPATPPSKPPSPAGKTKSISPRGVRSSMDYDSRSMVSLQSDRRRRHSIAGSSVRDDDSLASSPAIPGYMASTESARARSRFSPLRDSFETPEKGSVSSVKKRLSFPAMDKQIALSPAKARRHSGPPKVDIASLKDVAIHGEEITENEGTR